MVETQHGAVVINTNDHYRYWYDLESL